MLDQEDQRLALAGDPWGDLRRRIDRAGAELRGFLSTRGAGGRIAGYGAPAKLTTLCHQFGITRADIDVIVDDSAWKQGLLAPGTRIPVVPPWTSTDPMPDAIVVFAWNFAGPIAKKIRGTGYAGKIVVPLPAFKELA
jgi:hypothetical protein